MKIIERIKTLDTERPKDPELSEKRKRAMLEYMAILFVMAFLLVVLSLIVQNRNLRQASSANIHNNMTLEGRIENLQDENRELRTLLAQNLLATARRAYAMKDTYTFVQALEQLEPYADALRDDEREEYNRLSQALPAEKETE